MRFHITITNNESGEVLIDQDTKAIIGAFDGDENSTHCMGYTSCNVSELLNTAVTAAQTAYKLLENPSIPKGMRAAAILMANLDGGLTDDDTDDTDN